MKKQTIWAVIPAYNEEKHISKVISKTRKYVDNLVVVDDGSKDRTYDLAISSNSVVLRHIINLGKGAAIKTGCDYVIKHGAQKIVLIDSDAQHEPEEIPKFIKGLDEAEIVFGYRRRSKTMPLVLKFGNWFINKATKLLYGIALKDTQCGYRAFTKGAYSKIKWASSGYSMESEMIANAGKNKLKYSEVPIKTIYCDKYKGTTVIDGMKIVFNMLWWRFTRG